jgi:hypothetical protein
MIPTMLKSDVPDTPRLCCVGLATTRSHGALVTHALMLCFSVFFGIACCSKFLVAYRALEVLALLVYSADVLLQTRFLGLLPFALTSLETHTSVDFFVLLHVKGDVCAVVAHATLHLVHIPLLAHELPPSTTAVARVDAAA